MAPETQATSDRYRGIDAETVAGVCLVRLRNAFVEAKLSDSHVGSIEAIKPLAPGEGILAIGNGYSRW